MFRMVVELKSYNVAPILDFAVAQTWHRDSPWWPATNH